jgi:hypothetical protein
MEKLQRLLEDMQKRMSELTVAQTNREKEQAKELDRLQTLLAHRERELQSVR